MKHTELTNHIRGSILKQQYLEAFLVQGAYIESLLKSHADFSVWKETVEMKNSDFVGSLRKDIGDYGLYKLIEFLRKSKFISNSLAGDFHVYRNKRNSIIHDLLGQIYSESFEGEMRDICDLGERITSSDEFEEILAIIRDYEEQMVKKSQAVLTVSRSSSEVKKQN